VIQAAFVHSLENLLTELRRLGMPRRSHRPMPQNRRDNPAAQGSSGFLRRDFMRPAYRTGSSSEALAAARRTQLHRGLGLVLGVFTLYALVSSFAPEWLTAPVGGGLQVGELAAVAQVLAVAYGVFRHDRHARRHIEPLAQRVSTREPGRYGERFAAPGRPATGFARGSATGAAAGAAATPSAGPAEPADSAVPAHAAEAAAAYAAYAADPAAFAEPEAATPFNAFDSPKAFAGRGPGTLGSIRTARATS
jgi:uncharacterized membrane protein (DUF485 family)